MLKSQADADLVNLTLYYETLCPDCRGFMTGQVWTAYNSVASIMNLTLVPYGNAKVSYQFINNIFFTSKMFLNYKASIR